MYVILSPSKSQDFSRNFRTEIRFEKNIFLKETEKLHGVLKNKSKDDLKKIINISENLAKLNFERFQIWTSNFKKRIKNNENIYNFSPSIFAFTGDVYRGFELEKYSEKDFEFLNNNIGIISGFYGILKPFDLIKPYRLEMGTKINFSINKVEYGSLYKFWENKLTEKINNILKNKKVSEKPENQELFILNLASKEYSKVINFNKINFPVLNIEFKIRKNKDGKKVDKVVAIYAKRARGEMANWIVKNKINKKNDLKKFSENNWNFDSKNSTDNNFIYFLEK